MRMTYPDSSVLIPVPLAELTLKEAPIIPRVEKVLSEYGKFPPPTNPELPKIPRAKKLSPSVALATTYNRGAIKTTPNYLGSFLDVMAT